MNGMIESTARLIEAVKRVYAKKWAFFVLFACAFLGSVATLAVFDLLPEVPPALVAIVPVSKDQTSVVNLIELPTNIEISALNLKATIENPTTTDVAILDRGLLKGAVRYPTSAKLGEAGNVVLFGHSSYLPIVGNQAYKTFNGIQKLVAGDSVTVSSSSTAYTYKVRSVAKESATSNEGIELATVGRVLTLVTCNSFATKSDRFVVTADFVESHPIAIL